MSAAQIGGEIIARLAKQRMVDMKAAGFLDFRDNPACHISFTSPLVVIANGVKVRYSV